MSASYTYTQLKTALQNMVEDNSDEFQTFIDDIIRIGESRVIRDLDLTLFNIVLPGTMVNGVSNIGKPADLISTDSFTYIDGTGARVFLEPRSYDYIMDYSDGVTTAPPKYIAELDSSNWLVGPTPDSNYTYTAYYLARPISLTATQTNSWLGDHVGDVLFFSCLIATEQYLKADDRIDVWKKTYAELVPAAKDELRVSSRNAFSPLAKGPKAES